MTLAFQLARFEVHKFRGEQSVSSDLGSVNFIIGRNGTGKTTLINLLLAAIKVDIGRLSWQAFESIRLFFAASDPAGLTASVEITREKVEEVEFIVYRFVDWPVAVTEEHRFAAAGKANKLAFDRSYRNKLFHMTGEAESKLLQELVTLGWRGRDNIDVKEARKAISELTELRNISVTRWTGESGEEPKGSSDVDKKISGQLNEVAAILNKKDRSFTELLQAYQADFFISLTDRSMIEDASIAGINLNDDIEKLGEIFENFRIPTKRYAENLHRHRDEVKRAFELFGNGAGMSMPELAAYLDGVRLHAFVNKWDDLLEARKEIYETKTILSDVINEMYLDKTFAFLGDNKAQFQRRGTSVDVDSLASGEKQLFIFLLEAFVQQRRPVLFVADEPEISLHIEWQAELVDKIQRINPFGQLIFATHSPDIVAHHKQNIISLG